jgi:hypothetical protein
MNMKANPQPEQSMQIRAALSLLEVLHGLPRITPESRPRLNIFLMPSMMTSHCHK